MNTKLPGSNNRAGSWELSLCLDFRAVLHGEADILLGKDGHMVHHAVPEAGIIFLDRTVLLFE